MEKPKDNSASGYARNKLQFCIDELKSRFEEFLYPLSKVELKESDNRADIYTDGINIYYSPEYVFSSSVEDLKYRIMHIIMHGVLGHFEKNDEYKNKTIKECAWTVMDAQVGMVLDMLGFKTHNIDLENVDKLLGGQYDFSHLKRAKGDAKYSYRLEWEGKCIKSDDHIKWGADSKDFWDDIRGFIPMDFGGNISDLFNRIKYIIKNSKMSESDGKEGSFRISRNQTRSYADILRNLVNVADVSSENPDSIDYMTYQYGLDMYGNVALIEPAEESENTTINTIVLAVDVSGSCTNDKIMGVFWNETYSFLSQLKDKTSNGEVYLIQCDDKIQKEEHFSVDKITDKVPEIVKINGFGGTSFNPVFKRIEELIHNGKKIGGLIYLTDGVGTCSDEKRDYPVYFVIPDKNNNVQQYLPDWIECVYLGGKLCTQ